MKKLTILLALLFLFAALPLPAAEVKNTVVRQVGNRGQFTYDLLGDEPEAEVDVTLTIQGKEYKAADLHLEGDCGKVKTGRGRVIWWNILQDFPRGLDAAVKWRVEAGRKEFKDAATGWIGVAVQEITPEIAQHLGISGKRGVIVGELQKGSSAEEVGIRPMDIILQVNKVKIYSLKDYFREISKSMGKKGILLLIKRGKTTFFVLLLRK